MMEESEYYWVDAPTWAEPSKTLVPSWWRNIIIYTHQHQDPTSQYPDYERLRNEIINSELERFSGQYFPSYLPTVKSRLRFDSESGFTAFLLIWS